MSAIASAADAQILFIAGRMPDVANVRWLPKEYRLHDEACKNLDWALLKLNPVLIAYRIEVDIIKRSEI
jgi:hypothetical protein